MTSLRRRVEKLEKRYPPDPFRFRVVFTDAAGLVQDDGSAVLRPYVGRHYSELPAGCQIYVGIDPDVFLGRKLLPEGGNS